MPEPSIRILRLSLFQSQFKPQPRMAAGVWHQLVREYFTRPDVRTIKDGMLFSPAIYNSTLHRKNENVEALSMLVLDMDSKEGCASHPDDHVDNLEGLAHAYYSTWRSTPELPRWRLILPLDRDISPEEHAAVWAGGRALLGNDPVIDRSCGDASRAYFLPSCPPGREGEFFLAGVTGQHVSADYLIELSGEIVMPPRDRAEVVPIRETHPAPTAMVDEIRDCLSYINPDCGYEHWLNIGMALHSVGDDSLLEVWEEWSAQGSKYANATGSNSPRYMWQSFKRRADGVTIRSLFHMAREAGREAPPLAAPAAPGAAPVDDDLLFYDIFDLVDDPRPTPPYLIEGLFRQGDNILLAGPPKSQKSFLMQDILFGLLFGRDVLGFKVPAPVNVAWIQAEMPWYESRKRADEHPFFVEYRQTGEISPAKLFVSDRFTTLSFSEKGIERVIEAIRRRFGSDRPQVIAIDSLSAVYDQDSEDGNAQMQLFLRSRIGRLREAFGDDVAILIIHHTTKQPLKQLLADPFLAIRGASSLRGWYTAGLVMHRASDDRADPVRLLHFELRGDKEPESMEVILDRGAVKRYDSPDTSGLMDNVARQAEIDFMTLLDHFTRIGHICSAEPRSRNNYAPRMFVQAVRGRAVRDISTKSEPLLQAAMSRLVEAGKLLVVDTSQGKNGTRKQLMRPPTEPTSEPTENGE